jgi:hypothetical protein
MAKKRFSPKSIFIACEGKNTEPLYFEKIKEIKECDDFYSFSLTVYPDRNEDKPKSDAIGLIIEAIERINEFDELWVVFDKDGYTKHKEAFELAKSKGINVCFSSISFEMWVLLHFELNINSFAKSAEIINDKFLNNEKYFENYSKSGDLSIFPYLEDKTKNAFINSSILKNFNKIHRSQIDLFDLNPYSDVDVLVKKLLEIDITFDSCYLNQDIEYNTISIKIINNNDTIVFKLKNTNSALVLNEFKFFNENDDASNQIILKNIVIEPNAILEIPICKKSDVKSLIVKFQKLYLTVIVH